MVKTIKFTDCTIISEFVRCALFVLLCDGKFKFIDMIDFKFLHVALLYLYCYDEYNFVR